MKAARQSNIELLRIVAMFFIIAYHCVCNSTLWLELDFAHPSAKSILVQLWGMWGKTGINVFVLISGYFMCVSHLTVKQYQVYQPDIDHLIVRVVPVASELPKEICDQIVREMRKIVGDKIEFVIENVETIPLTKRGKRAFVVSNVRRS